MMAISPAFNGHDLVIGSPAEDGIVLKKCNLKSIIPIKNDDFP